MKNYNCSNFKQLQKKKQAFSSFSLHACSLKVTKTVTMFPIIPGSLLGSR